MEAGGLNINVDPDGTHEEGKQGQGSPGKIIGRGGSRRA